MSQKLKHDMDASLRFTEATADFGSLIVELGAERAWRMLKDSFPQQAEQLRLVANTPPQARLFCAPTPV